MRKQQRKQLRLIAVSLAKPALQLGALQHQLIAARKLGLSRCGIGLINAEALGSRMAAHERKVDKKERGELKFKVGTGERGAGVEEPAGVVCCRRLKKKSAGRWTKETKCTYPARCI
jgi:hypothetical protein